MTGFPFFVLVVALDVWLIIANKYFLINYVTILDGIRLLYFNAKSKKIMANTVKKTTENTTTTTTKIIGPHQKALRAGCGLRLYANWPSLYCIRYINIYEQLFYTRGTA